MKILRLKNWRFPSWQVINIFYFRFYLWKLISPNRKKSPLSCILWSCSHFIRWGQGPDGQGQTGHQGGTETLHMSDMTWRGLCLFIFPASKATQIVHQVMKTFGILKLCIKAGEIICVDDPTVAVLCPDIKDNIKCHCLHCFRPTKAPLPCDVSFVIIAHHKKTFLSTRIAAALCFALRNAKRKPTTPTTNTSVLWSFMKCLKTKETTWLSYLWDWERSPRSPSSISQRTDRKLRSF